MKKPTEVLELFRQYQGELDLAIDVFLKDQGNLDMYGMMRYFMGFTDSSFHPLPVFGGKRFRPGLTLFIADSFGVKDRAFDAAVSIELFHNFTLIHDDIVDGDTLRRGRETLWKIWGIPEAINTGDAQSLLSCQKLIEGIKKYPDTGAVMAGSLISYYKEVAEGQHLDFFLSKLPIDDSRVTEEAYNRMIEKKTSVLVGASTKAGALAAGCSEEECGNFWRYGQSLGFAYQLHDDFVGIWGEQEITGKSPHNDLREKKKTLPVLRAFQSLLGEDRDSFVKMYKTSFQLDEVSMKEIVKLINKTDAKEYTLSAIKKAADLARDAARMTSLSDEKKDTLLKIIDALLPLTT